MAFRPFFVIHARAAACKLEKKPIFMKSKPNITYPSTVLVASNASPLRAPRSTKIMLEKQV